MRNLQFGDLVRVSALLAFRGMSQTMRTRKSRVNSFASLIGTLGSFACGVAAWSEWFFIKKLYPSDGSPVPHSQFAFQALVLLLGCLVATLAVPLFAVRVRCTIVIVCAVPPVTFVGYQLWRLYRGFL